MIPDIKYCKNNAKNSHIFLPGSPNVHIFPYLLYHYLSVYNFSTYLLQASSLRRILDKDKNIFLHLRVILLKAFSMSSINNILKITKYY